VKKYLKFSELQENFIGRADEKMNEKLKSLSMLLILDASI